MFDLNLISIMSIRGVTGFRLLSRRYLAMLLRFSSRFLSAFFSDHAAIISALQVLHHRPLFINSARGFTPPHLVQAIGSVRCFFQWWPLLLIAVLVPEAIQNITGGLVGGGPVTINVVASRTANGGGVTLCIQPCAKFISSSVIYCDFDFMGIRFHGVAS